jgi:hypothetical protein
MDCSKPDGAEAGEDVGLPDAVVADPDETDARETLLPLGTFANVVGEIEGLVNEGLFDGSFSTPTTGNGLEEPEALERLTGLAGADEPDGMDVNPETGEGEGEELDGGTGDELLVVTLEGAVVELELEELVEVVPQPDIVEYDVAHRVRYIVVYTPMSPIVVVQDVAVATQELLLTEIGGVVEIEGGDVVGGEELVEELLEELGDDVGTELLDEEDELELVGGGSIEEVEELELLGLELDEVVVVVLDELEEDVMVQPRRVKVVVKQVATGPLSSSSVVQPA